jgi:hypothetical protein
LTNGQYYCALVGLFVFVVLCAVLRLDWFRSNARWREEQQSVEESQRGFEVKQLTAGTTPVIEKKDETTHG